MGGQEEKSRRGRKRRGEERRESRRTSFYLCQPIHSPSPDPVRLPRAEASKRVGS